MVQRRHAGTAESLRHAIAGGLMSPAVSVILNCYNHEAYVAEAVESVLAQTFGDFELILIDNGSTDGSRAVLERYDDPRIRRFFHDDNQSLSKRLNEGVAAARGEFVAILYSDDWMLPDKLERQVPMLAALPDDYGAVYCPALGFNQHTGVTWQDRSMAKQDADLSTLLRHHFDGSIDMSSPLTRRKCFERYRWHEDLFGDGEAVFFRIAMRWKFAFDPQPTVVLRDHGGNMGKAIVKNHDMVMTILDRLADHPDFPAECAADLDFFRARACRNNAWVALRLGSSGSWARAQLGRAISLRPSELMQPRMLAAMLLAALPDKLRAGMNRAGDRLRARPENRTFVEDY
jgi:glycosyltransferase involved in cell wall biosynthesis